MLISVSNGGLILGSLAIYEDDTTNTASQLLERAVPNAVANCARGTRGSRSLFV